jgi:hypothetical protein
MTTPSFAAILQAGMPALHIISVIAVLICAGAGVYIYCRRHELFDRDAQLPEYQDSSGVRHIRLELVLIVWGALMILMIATLYAIWTQ